MSNSEQPIDEQQWRTDLRTTPQKINAIMALPNVKGAFYALYSILCVIYPLLLFSAILVFVWFPLIRPSRDFPGRAPFQTKLKDKSDPHPAGGYRKARGEVFIGHHRGTGKEVWCSWDDLMTHLYLLGTTGSGKSEAFWAILTNFYCGGSAYQLADGKGTVEMIQDGRTLARLFGKEDDYFVINYQDRDKSRPYTRMSNTLNSWAVGTAAQLKEQLASLALSGDAGQNQFFQDTAESLIERVFPALVQLRDDGLINLNIQSIGKYIELKNLYELSKNPNVEGLYQGYIRSFLNQVGFKEDTPDKQPEDVTKMYSQFSSQFLKTISSLSIQYRDIYVVDQGEINQRDITSNRRTLMYTLPSMDKSSSELQNLGNILLTGTKNSLSKDLGSRVEGTIEQTQANRSKGHKIPYGLGFDEWSFFATKDMGLLPAQMRGIKYGGLYGAQDYAGTERGSEMDAEQTFANTRLKFFGGLEEAGKTWTKIRELIGEVLTAVNNNYKYLPGLFGGRRIIDREQTEVTRRQPIEIADLQKQTEGEFFMLMRGRLSPIKFFYTGLEDMAKEAAPGNHFKLNKLCRVYPPSGTVLAHIDRTEAFLETMFSNDVLYQDLGMLRGLQMGCKQLRQDPSTDASKIVPILNQWIEENASKLGITLPKPHPASADYAPSSGGSLPGNGVPQERPGTSIGDGNTAPKQDTEADLGGFMDLGAEQSGPASSPPAQPPEESVTQPHHQTADTPAKDTADLTQSPDPEEATENDLENETLEAKRAINEADTPPEGAHVLSDQEASQLKNQLTSLNTFLGLDEDLAAEAAERTLDQLDRQCYYLAPPKPNQLDDTDIDALDNRVDELLDGA